MRLTAAADAMLSDPTVDRNFGRLPIFRVGGRDESLVAFDLSSIPPTAAVNSAALELYISGSVSDAPVNAHRVATAWTEGSTTFASFGQHFDPTVLGGFATTSPNTQKSVDLTPLVTSWLTGSTPNYGICLETASDTKTIFVSREGGTECLRPHLRLCYTVPDDHCTPNPCDNGGTCQNGASSYTCQCKPGYTGPTCATAIDSCASTPCLHGGSCSDAVASYTCTCPTGYTGTQCQTLVDNCTSAPCQNGGACQSTASGYTCTCPPGYTGATCQTLVDNCANAPCLNGGACTNSVGSYTCTCATGFSGTQCQNNVDECATSPCDNGGTCVDGINAFTCSCPPGWGGPTCDVNLDMCAQQPCLNGATCTDGTGTYACTCAPGYSGTNCEVDINDCAPNPCLNGGTCVDLVNGYTCTCPSPFSGATCATNQCPDIGDTSCFLPGVCAAGNQASSCTNGVETACQTGAPSGVSEAICNGLDDNCNGQVDEDAPPAACPKTVNVVIVYDAAAVAALGGSTTSRIADAFASAAARYTDASNATGTSQFAPAVSLNLAAQISWAGSGPPPGMMFPTGADPIDPTALLSAFQTWVSANQSALRTVAGTPADEVLLVTGHSFTQGLDLDYLGGICGQYSMGIDSVALPLGGYSTIGLGTLLAHTIGHSLGLPNDNPTSPGSVMSALFDATDYVDFSTASATALASFFTNTYGKGPRCLDDPAVEDWSTAHCGDGREQGAEQCDPTAGVTDSCCTPTCGLAAGCACGNSDPCCANGAIVPAASGQVCRPARGECDFADTCDGTGSECSRDLYASPGTPCSKNGVCLDGVCESGDALCKELGGASFPQTTSCEANSTSSTPCTGLSCYTDATLSECVVWSGEPDGISCGTGMQCNGGVCEQSSSLKEYAWAVGTWSACASGTQTRTVTCQDETGATVATSFCATTAQPVGTQACS